GDIWLKGFESAGIRMVPAPVGMNSTEFKGRPACLYDGWCHVGCPIGALANPLVTYLGDARKAGAEVRASSTVTRVLTDANGRRDVFGPDLHAFMKRAARGLTRIGAFGEATPNIENRVELATDKDELGVPLGRIVHSYDEDAAKLWNANFAEGLAIAKAAG